MRLAATRADLQTGAMIRTVFILLAMTLPATASDMAMFIKNQYSRGVALEFFGQETGTRWPGNDKVYFLDRGERKSIPISCQEGERICYGAWVNGNDKVFWGVGPDNNRSCETCCTVCVEKSTEAIVIE